MTAPYWQGPADELRGFFTGDGGAAVAATGVSFRVRKPDASLLTVTATENAAKPGEWLGVVVADQVGEWAVKAACTGPQPAVEQLGFTVRASLPG